MLFPPLFQVVTYRLLYVGEHARIPQFVTQGRNADSRERLRIKANQPERDKMLEMEYEIQPWDYERRD